MTSQIETRGQTLGPEYVALRQGGTPPLIARTQLGLSESAAVRSERLLRRRRLCGEGRPQFAHDGAHVAAVLSAGGYPALAERGA